MKRIRYEIPNATAFFQSSVVGGVTLTPGGRVWPTEYPSPNSCERPLWTPTNRATRWMPSEAPYQAVVAIGRRERRQERERLPAQIAEAPADPNPVMICVVGLLL